MNEAQLIRAQLAAEREHLREVASLCAAAHTRIHQAEISPYFISSCINYLLFSMNKERTRSAALLECSSRAHERAHEKAGNDLRRALSLVTDALGELQARSTARSVATDARQTLEELERCTALVDRLIDSRLDLETLAEREYSIVDWRRVAHVDADSILEERKLRTEVLRHGAGA